MARPAFGQGGRWKPGLDEFDGNGFRVGAGRSSVYRV